jgi:Ni/Co efflux regulator RcnB
MKKFLMILMALFVTFGFSATAAFASDDYSDHSSYNHDHDKYKDNDHDNDKYKDNDHDNDKYKDRDHDKYDHHKRYGHGKHKDCYFYHGKWHHKHHKHHKHNKHDKKHDD